MHIFAAYRRNMMRFITSGEEMVRKKKDFSEKISNIEAGRIETVSQIEKYALRDKKD